MTNTKDTIEAVGDATIVNPDEGTGEIVFKLSGELLNGTFGYTNTGSDVNFTLDGTGDNVEPLEFEGVTIANSKKPFTITMTDEIENAQQFEVSALAKGAVYCSDASTPLVTFGKNVDGGLLFFGNDAIALTGVTAAEGDSVTFNAQRLTSDEESEDEWFRLDDHPINIAVTAGENGLVYDSKDKSIAGFRQADDVTVVNAGVVKKIFIHEGITDTTTFFVRRRRNLIHCGQCQSERSGILHRRRRQSHGLCFHHEGRLAHDRRGKP